jgi:hypothetical protein
MSIKIWDSHNQQWLEPMAIYFGKDNSIWKIDAVKPGDDPLTDGWYDLRGEDLKKISIIGEIKHNESLLIQKENENGNTRKSAQHKG